MVRQLVAIIRGSSRRKQCFQSPGDREPWTGGALVTKGLSSAGITEEGGARGGETPQPSHLVPPDRSQIPPLAEPNCMFEGVGAWGGGSGQGHR